MAKKRIIECSVNDEYVIGSGVPVGAAGSHGDVALRVTFSDMWAAKNIYATFRNSRGENPTLVPILATDLVAGELMTYDVPIPASAKRYKGMMMVTFSAYEIGGGMETLATNTATAYFRVLESDFALFDDESIDATVAQQLQDEIREFETVTQDEFETVYETISAGLGKQGAVEIPADAWSGDVAIVSVEDAGANDMIIFSPATEADKVTLNNCGVFITPSVNEGIVRLSCRVKPTVAISLVYFITRGAE